MPKTSDIVLVGLLSTLLRFESEISSDCRTPILVLSPCFIAFCPAFAQSTVKATALLKQALEAQGGEQKRRALRSVQWGAIGYRNEVEESERPEGPYVTEFKTISEVHNFSGNRSRSVTQLEVLPVYKAIPESLS